MPSLGAGVLWGRGEGVPGLQGVGVTGRPAHDTEGSCPSVRGGRPESQQALTPWFGHLVLSLCPVVTKVQAAGRP